MLADNEETLDMFPHLERLVLVSYSDHHRVIKPSIINNRPLMLTYPQPKTEMQGPRKNSEQILVASGVNAELTMQHSQLLTSIRKGIQLKKVQHEVQMKERMAAMPWDVTAILERRHTIEMSDNEVEEGVVLDTEWKESQ